MPWELTGNSGTNPATNFLGTTDNQPLAIKTNGAERLHIASDGGVGIGTTTPSARLSVAGPNAPELSGSARSATLLTSAGSLGEAAGDELALATIGFVSASSSSLGIRAARTTNGSDWLSTAIGLGMDVDDTECAGASLWLHANGNIGIGTTTPSARLSVAGPNAPELSGSTRSATLLTSAGSLGEAAGDELALATIGFVSGNSSSLGIRGARVANGSSWVSTAIGLGMDVDNTIRAGASLWLHANGNIGIGTTTPSARLSVAGPNAPELSGSARSATLLTSAGSLGEAAGDELALATIGFVSASSSSLGIRAARTTNGSDWLSTAIGLGMDVDDTECAGASLWLHANGNIGIGTTTPSARLSVAGPNAPELSGSTRSATLLTSAGSLGEAAGDELALATIGFVSGNSSSLGIRGARVANGSSWVSTAIGLGMDVDNTIRAGASLWLHANGNIGIGTTTPSARLSVAGPNAPELSGSARSATLLTSAGSLGEAAGDELALATIGFVSGNSSSLGIRGARVANGSSWVSTAIGLGMDVDNTIRAGASLWLHANGNVGIGTTTPSAKLTVQGDVSVTGDVILTGADCAEEFDIAEAAEIEPGMVVVFDQGGTLHQCRQAYDKRVAGVISGAGDYKPGLILDRQQSQDNRMPVALVGKVYCKVDAQYAPIGVGDLLTTSPTPGHAMKSDNPFKAFGAVLGKALRSLQNGQGLIPVLVTLQ